MVLLELGLCEGMVQPQYSSMEDCNFHSPRLGGRMQSFYLRGSPRNQFTQCLGLEMNWTEHSYKYSLYSYKIIKSHNHLKKKFYLNLLIYIWSEKNNFHLTFIRFCYAFDGSFLYTNCFSAKPNFNNWLRKKLEKEIQNPRHRIYRMNL